VIRGVGVASDGRGVSVMAPRVEGEELALRLAYEEAGVSPSTVGLVEAHGTATAVGDVVEVEALTRVFGGRDGELASCALGTVKSMISHTIPASGIAGIIKLALSLYHRVLPPTLNCDEPNPKLGLEQTPFYLNTETRPWIQAGPEPRRAGINAFGFGGINAHAVLEEVAPTLPLDHLPPWDTEACVLAAESPAALLEDARRLRQRLDAEPSFTLTDLAYTLNCLSERPSRAVRLAVVAESLDDLAAKLDRAIEKLSRPDCRRIKDISGIYYEAEPLAREGKVVLVFPGEGAQYAGMLAGLCLHFPEVREIFDRADRTYRDHPRGYVTSDWIFPRPAFSDEERRFAEERLMQMDVAVEAVLTANLAMQALLERLGLRADACVGHSTGEYSAAHAAGVLVVDTEERFFAFCRGLHQCYADAEVRDDLPRALLLTVAADRAHVEEIARQAGGELFVAMDNCPHQAVIVGEHTAVERARDIAAREGLIYGELPYDRAVHTRLFAAYADGLRDVFDGVEIGSATTTLYSCTTAAPYPAEEAAIRELFVDHWTHPVEFRRTIERLYDEGARVFVEAGPRGNMTGFIDDILRGRPYCSVPADLPRRTSIAQLNHLVAMLSVHDVELDPAYLYERRKVRPVVWEDRPADEQQIPARTSVALAMRWPLLRLPDEVTARFGAPPAATNGSGHHARVPELAAQAKPAPPPPVAPQPVAEAAPGVAEDELALVMDAHTETMEHFLTAHQQVMQLYLAESELEHELATARPETASPPAGPLLGRVLAWTPGESLVARRVFDPDHDVYLRDHALGRAVSSTDPALSALMVMPLTMSLEILAEAAAALVPGRLVVGLSDVRAFRWLAWEEEPRMLEVTAERLSRSGDDDRVHVKLFDLGASGGKGAAAGSPAVEAVVVLSDAYPSPPPLEPPAADGLGPSRWQPEELYTDGMFHGPLWQGVRAIERTGPGGTSARLEVLPFGGLLRSESDPAFVLDPVMLDAAGQVIGFWTGERFETGRVVFPFRLGRLDVFGPRRPEGEPLACTAAIELIGDQLVRSDIDVAASDGTLWLRLSGWEDKRFDLPPAFAPLARLSDRTPISSELPGPIEPFEGEQLECRRLTAVLPDRALWTGVWASRVLSRAERAAFRRLRLPEERTLEWLAARTAAKEAVQRLVRRHYGFDLLAADIEILPDDVGRPVVGGAWTADVPAVPVVSLAHTQGTAVALAALRGRVGIDVEHVGRREESFAAVAFSEQERTLLASLAPEERDEWALRCWCAKEAVGKALGSGLTRGPQGLAVTEVDPGTGRISVRLGEAMAADHAEVGSAQLVVHSRREGDLVVATTLCQQGGLSHDAG
jgi:malonyl CoA-acyl carrier protein transacylase/phosphopantetheinyl transferase